MESRCALRLQPLGDVHSWHAARQPRPEKGQSRNAWRLCLFGRRRSGQPQRVCHGVYRRCWKHDASGESEPGGAPIAVSLGYASTDKVRFDTYSVCGPNKKKPVNPADPVFIISAIDPQNCPVWLTDNKGTNYTFTIKPTVATPPLFTNIPTSAVIKVPSQAGWSTGKGYPESGNNPTPYDTTRIIDCSGNTSTLTKLWCCTRLAPSNGEGFGSGVFAYSTPVYPPTGHASYDNHVVTNPATDQVLAGAVCNMGRP